MNIKRLFYFVGVLVSFVLALTAWGFSSPVGSSPDDDFHLASIWCSTLDTKLCQEGQQDGSRQVSSQLLEASCFAYLSENSASCQIENNIFTDAALITSDRGNFSGLYPPAFYSTMHLMAGDDVQSSTLKMRFLNILIFVLLGSILFSLIGTRERNNLLLTLLITLVPLGMFLIPSTNPSSWALMGITFGMFGLINFFQAEAGLRKNLLGIFFLVSCIVAAGARGDAGAYLILLSGVVVVVFWKWGKWKDLIYPLLGVILSGLFFLSTKQSNVATSGLSLPTGDGGEQIIRSAFSVFGFNVLQLPELWAGIFGFVGLGWLDTRLPAITWVSAVTVFCAVVFARMRGLNVREYGGVIILGLALIAVPMYVLQISSSHVGENIQPRYVYPLLAGATAIALSMGDVTKDLLGKAQTVIIYAAIVLANAFALYTNLSRYIQGQGWGTDWNLNLAATSGWWWQNGPAPMLLWGVGSIAFALAFSPLLSGKFLFQKTVQ